MTKAKYMPGEKRKKSLVTEEFDSLDAAFFAPDKLDAHRKRDTGDTIIEQDYIVKTRRFDGRWQHTVIKDGVEWDIPHSVLGRLNDQVKAIIHEERSERGKRQAAQRKAELSHLAAADQLEAEDLEQDTDFQRLLAE